MERYVSILIIIVVVKIKKMKKSELRHRIREIIREQRDDLEKNKLRPIKPE